MAHQGRKRWAVPTLRLGHLAVIALVAVFAPNVAKAAGVVGIGTPASCTEGALGAALAGGGLVTFNCGAQALTITLTSEKVITAATSIDGGGRIALSGGGEVRIFRVDGRAVLDVRNLTIADGAAELGGGIWTAGNVTLTNCTLKGNSIAGVGGSGGGAIYNGGALTLTNCTLSGNSARAGGSMFHGGGAIYNGGTLRLTNSTLSGNSAGSGGGIWSEGTLTLTNCTLSGNSADVGGGIYSDGTPLTLTNCTLSENGGGAIVNDCVLGECPPATLTNTIIVQTEWPGCVGIADGGHNLQWPGMNCVPTIPSLDPLLDPAGLRDNGGPTQTIALLPDSPAINAGDPEVCANPPVNGVDQRGYVRPGTGAANCSIGAYEYNSPGPPPSCGGDCRGDGLVTIDELITMVNIALGQMAVARCTAGDADNDGDISVDEIITAVAWALNGCEAQVLPWKPGPFGVGYRRVKFTKESVTVPGQLRELDTWVWYPADPLTAPLDKFPMGKGAAPLAAGAQHLPLVIFSHGSCGFPSASLFLTTVVASYGFVVAAPPHPGNSAGIDCETQAAREDSYANRPADVSFVIDSLLALNDTSDSFFHDSLDAARIGVMGHSFGGATTLRVSAADARVIAGLALAPGITEISFLPDLLPFDEIPRIKIPIMIQGGDLDTLIPFEPVARRAYDLLGPPRYLVKLLYTGHFAFGNECTPGYACGAGEPATLTQDEAHRASLRYAVPFLLHYVAGDHRLDAYLAPAPGFVFTADTGAPTM